MSTIGIMSATSRTSDYEDIFLRPGVIDIGWHLQDPIAQSNNDGVTNPQWSRNTLRGSPNLVNWGYDMTYLTPDSTDPNWNKRWIMPDTNDTAGNRTSAPTDDAMSSPVLYAVGQYDITSGPLPTSVDGGNRGWWKWFQGKNPYMPTYPLESRWQASLRYHRALLESTISSLGEANGGSPWMNVNPWIPMPGGEAWIWANSLPANLSFCVTLSRDESLRQLSLLRSKRISELMAFNPARPVQNVPCPTQADSVDGYYPAFEKVYRQTFEPRLVTVYNDANGASLEVVDHSTADVLYTSLQTSPSPLALDAVEDTNERWQATNNPSSFNGKQRVLRTSIVPQTSSTALTTKVEGIARVTSGSSNTLAPTETLRLTLECSVTVDNGCGFAALNQPPSTTCNNLTHLEGRISLAHPSGNGQILIPPSFECTPDANPNNDKFEVASNTQLFGFWAPRTTPQDVTQIVALPSPCASSDEPSSLVGGSYNVIMRRTFDVDFSVSALNSLIDSEGKIKFGLLVRAISHSGTFASTSKLTVDWNLIQITRIDRAPPPTSTTLPGGEGAAMASTPLSDGGPIGADLNTDNQVNLLDLQTFLDAQAAGLPTGDYNNDGTHNDTDIVEFAEDYVNAP